MLTENQRAFVRALVRAPDRTDPAPLWRECGCAADKDTARQVVLAIGKFLNREDVKGLQKTERQVWDRYRKRQERELARGDYDEARARAFLQRVLVEEVADAVVTGGAEIAKGRMERMAAFAKVCEIGHKIAGATQGNVALTDAQRRALHEMELAAKGGEVEAPVAGDEPDTVAPAPDLPDEDGDGIAVGLVIEGIA